MFFSNNQNARPNQDVGLDGVRNDEEAEFYSDFVNEINSNASISQEAKDRILQDVCS